MNLLSEKMIDKCGRLQFVERVSLYLVLILICDLFSSDALSLSSFCILLFMGTYLHHTKPELSVLWYCNWLLTLIIYLGSLHCRMSSYTWSIHQGQQIIDPAANPTNGANFYNVLVIEVLKKNPFKLFLSYAIDLIFPYYCYRHCLDKNFFGIKQVVFLPSDVLNFRFHHFHNSCNEIQKQQYKMFFDAKKSLLSSQQLFIVSLLLTPISYAAYKFLRSTEKGREFIRKCKRTLRKAPEFFVPSKGLPTVICNEAYHARG